MPAWVPLLLLFSGLIVGLQALQSDARGHGLARIDTTRYRLHADTQWMSPAWIDQLESLLIEVRELPVDDLDAVRVFAERIEALPFVSEVGVAEVQWPDGLSLPVRLREPVACIRTGDRDFLPVAVDGTVLGGYTYAPHEAYGGWLPTLGPHGLAERRGVPLQPGDRLTDPELLAGLSVAESLWRYLDVTDLRRLGRIVVDASAPDAPVIDPATGELTSQRLSGGVVLSLEEGRRVYFGRPPEPVVPGELPVGFKWQHVADALEGLATGAPWALLDVRFDDAASWTREQVEALAGVER